MQLEGISVLFSFIGGLGMFLYGMHVMANGLQHFAGGKMQRLMSFLTQNRLMAILVGTLVTAVIQSSSATTVMVVGFVNAGMLNLSQAVGVIMGANIGTTITAWLVSLSEFGSFLVFPLCPTRLSPIGIPRSFPMPLRCSAKIRCSRS